MKYCRVSTNLFGIWLNSRDFGGDLWASTGNVVAPMRQASVGSAPSGSSSASYGLNGWRYSKDMFVKDELPQTTWRAIYLMLHIVGSRRVRSPLHIVLTNPQYFRLHEPVLKKTSNDFCKIKRPQMRKFSTLNLCVLFRWTTLFLGSIQSEIISDLQSQNTLLIA